MAGETGSISFIYQLFSGLLEMTPEMEAVPDAAERWVVSKDGLRYVFHLRNDVRWSDGKPVTAEDFEYAWKRVLNPDIGSDIDDALCLAYLLRQPACELVGITTVTGQPVERAMLASAVCRAAGRDNIPIRAGAAKPLLVEQLQPVAPQAEA